LKSKSDTGNNASSTITKNLLLRHARYSDKKHVLKFCTNTFSWGDYIASAWDDWIDDGNLIIIEDTIPVAICHVFFSKTTLWIEGIRIRPSFRRLGLASKLILYAESLCEQNNKTISLLVNSKNIPCLKMVQKLGYSKKNSWYFYLLIPKNTGQKHVPYLKESCTVPFDTFVDSWRWLPIKDYFDDLLNKKQIIYSDLEWKIAYCIIRKSDYFEKTLSATLYVGSRKNNDYLISYLQELGYKNDLTVQIITSNGLEKYDDLKFITKDYNFSKKQL